jgi:hypothetical protein
VQKLVDSRTRYGVKARSEGEPACPVPAEDAGASTERIEVTRDELVALVDEALRARGMV